MAIETENKFAVASKGDGLCFIVPVPREISKPDALLLAAWLVAMAAEDEEEFYAVLEAVQNC